MAFSNLRIFFHIFALMYTIAFIHHSFSLGGISVITANIIRYLDSASKDFRVLVLVDPDDDSVLPDDLLGKASLVRVTDLMATVKEYSVDILIALSRREPGLASIKAETGCRIVYAEHGQPFHERFAIIDRRMGGRRRIWIKRLIWEIFLKRRYLEGGKAMRLAMQRSRSVYDVCDAYVVLCEAYRREFIGAFGLDPIENKFVVIGNPSSKVENVSLDKEKLLLYVGRLSDYDKKLDRLLRIWSSVQDRLPDWRLEIVGDGYERGRLEKLATKLQLRRCSFEGMQKDVGRYYDKASVCCLVSQTEGWPLCLAEAQSYGVIPLAFDCSGGVRTLLSPNGEFGFLVKHPDEKAYADCLVHIASMCDDDLMRIRRNVIARSSEYGYEQAGRKWLDLFQSLMK